MEYLCCMLILLFLSKFNQQRLPAKLWSSHSVKNPGNRQLSCQHFTWRSRSLFTYALGKKGIATSPEFYFLRPRFGPDCSLVGDSHVINLGSQFVSEELKCVIKCVQCPEQFKCAPVQVGGQRLIECVAGARPETIQVRLWECAHCPTVQVCDRETVCRPSFSRFLTTFCRSRPSAAPRPGPPSAPR